MNHIKKVAGAQTALTAAKLKVGQKCNKRNRFIVFTDMNNSELHTIFIISSITLSLINTNYVLQYQIIYTLQYKNIRK